MTFAALSAAPCAPGKVASAADVAAVATMLGEVSIAVAVAGAAAATAPALGIGGGADGLTPEEGMLPCEGLTPGDGLTPGEEVLLASL